MSVAEDYRRWAEVEAHGTSPAYERLALAVAEDARTLDLLEQVAPPMRQPNLLFGALRWNDVDVMDTDRSLQWIADHPQHVLEVLRTKRTQTNEPARCALLLPLLAMLPQPLAVIEIGASAGLCLLYDRWRYRYVSHDATVELGPDSRLVLPCEIDGPVPVPDEVPRIEWRRGLDLHPLDVADPQARRWLACLVWPEHYDRAERLATALEVACADPPIVVRGDIVTDLPALLAQVPAGLTTVVTHSATLCYLEPAQRTAVLHFLDERGVHRVGAEGARVLPNLEGIPAHAVAGPDFVISINQRAVALGNPHGRSLRWLA